MGPVHKGNQWWRSVQCTSLRKSPNVFANGHHLCNAFWRESWCSPWIWHDTPYAIQSPWNCVVCSIRGLVTHNFSVAIQFFGMYTYIFIFICIYTIIYIYLHTCMICTYMFIYTYLSLSHNICFYLQTCVYIYIYTGGLQKNVQPTWTLARTVSHPLSPNFNVVWRPRFAEPSKKTAMLALAVIYQHWYKGLRWLPVRVEFFWSLEPGIIHIIHK